MKMKLMKIFREMMNFGKVETESGILIFEGDVLTEGTEVFIEDENGNIVPAPDGVYGDYKVVEGKVAPTEQKEEEVKTESEEVKEEVKAEGEEEVKTEPEPEVDDKEARISALEQTVAELKAIVESLKEQKEEVEFSKLKPAEKEIKDVAVKETGALKYFK